MNDMKSKGQIFKKRSKMVHKKVKLIAILMLGLGLTAIHAQTVKDIDGNVYHTINIGTQVWMRENLKTTRYQNGDLIGTTTPGTMEKLSERRPKYQWAYDDKESNVSTYGRLYTWYAITDSRNVCPSGWHVPTDTEWKILTDYLKNNGYGYKGRRNDIAKSMAGTSGWNTSELEGSVGNDQSSNNSSGFTALPGGNGGDGIYQFICSHGFWWSSTESYTNYAWNRSLDFDYSYISRDYYNESYGSSVRCLRD
jgi:uncharacterized protein (TIGR02145 family)